jgi:2-dehydropantoate 2-reductase
MGQVPVHRCSGSTYVIVGSGAMARHISFYLSQLNFAKIIHWNRREHSVAEFALMVATASHVLLTISDSSLETFFNEHRSKAVKAQWIHFSGAQNIAGMIAVHPLMSFGPDLYNLEIYRKIHFAVTGQNSLRSIFPELENPFTLIPADKKALYHSLCVLGGNLPLLLWEKMNSGLSELGFPEKAADLYLERVFSNYLALRKNALTGPLKRKDLGTIQKNISALQGDSYQDVYRAFVTAQERSGEL